MASRVAEPIVLASYNLPARQTSASTRSKHVHAHVASSDRELVTVAVQGDGVHIIDTSSMHSVASYALGPSAAFACAAQSQQRNAGPTTTYAALASTNAQTDLHSWSGSISDKQEGTSQMKYTTPHAVHSIHTRKSQSTPLLIVTGSGQVLLADHSMNAVQKSSSTSSTATVRKAFVFDAIPCAFLPSASKARTSTTAVLFMEEDDALSVQVVVVDKDDEVTQLQNCDISVNSKDITDISCDVSGHASVLTSSGAWQLYLLAADGASVKCTEQSNVVNLSSRLTMAGASTLAMGSSHVLLAAATTDANPELVITLWDLRYSVVLGHFARPLPAQSASGDGVVALDLVASKPSHAVLVVSPSVAPQRGKGKGKASSNSALRTTVFFVSCIVPARSSIASALGHAADTARWIAPPPSPPSPDPKDDWAVLDAKRDEMLNALEVAMTQASKDAVEKIFFDWLAEETSVLTRRRQNLHAKKGGAPSNAVPAQPKATNGTTEPHDSDGDAPTEPHAAKDDQPADAHLFKAARESKPHMTFKFVTRLLGIILGPAKDGQSRPYPWEIMKYLAERKILSHSMVEGGLMPALLARGDWTHIVQCLKEKSVPDIPETELLRLLKIVIAGPAKEKDGAEAMDVDVDATASGRNHGKMPQLMPLLSFCVSYPTSPSALRAAMREHLTTVEDVTALLKILDNWLGSWSGIDDVARLRMEAKVDKYRADHAVRFSQALSFLQTLLDATFLMLVQHPPLQPLIQSLQAHIAPELELHVRIETLRGPLEQFSRHLQRQKDKEQEAKTSKGRRGRPRREERPGYQQPIGLYHVEQLTLWH